MTLEPVSESFALKTAGDLPPPDPDAAARIDAIWDEQKQLRGDHLYDAPLLVLDSYNTEVMVGRWATYRRYVAVRQDQLLGPLVPVGVSGILVCGDAVVLAERSRSVTSYPGFFELAPSGAIDQAFFDADSESVDYVAQLLRELEEEIELAPDQVAATRVLGVVQEDGDPCCDVCVRIDLLMGANELDRAIGSRDGDEYERVFRVPTDRLGAFASEYADRFLPTSRAILTHLGWLG